MATLEKATRPLLELTYGDTRQVSAVLPVRWCISPELVEILRQYKVEQPFLLISVRPYTESGEEGREGRRTYRDYGNETRYLVPLSQELQYVRFSRSGKSVVSAVVVWNEKGYGRGELKRVFLAGRKPYYETDVFGSHNEVAYSYLEVRPPRNSGRLRPYAARLLPESLYQFDVEVPAEMFAKEPRPWVKAYLGKFKWRSFRDECHLRRRKWSVMPLLPLFLVASLLLRVLLLALGLVAGMRGMSPGSVIHPFRDSIGDVLGDPDRPFRSIWFHKKDGTSRYPLLQLINPLTLLGLGIVVWVLSSIIGWDWSLGRSVVVSGVLHLAAVMALLVMAVLPSLGPTAVGRAWSRFWAWSEERRKQRTRAQREEELARRERELRAMVCANGGRPAALLSLPREKRVKLVFQATKAKVCRPFAH